MKTSSICMLLRFEMHYFSLHFQKYRITKVLTYTKQSSTNLHTTYLHIHNIEFYCNAPRFKIVQHFHYIMATLINSAPSYAYNKKYVTFVHSLYCNKKRENTRKCKNKENKLRKDKRDLLETGKMYCFEINPYLMC